MLVQTWGEVLQMSFQNLWAGVIAFLPQLVVALVVFIIGWVIAVGVGKLVERLVRAVHVDRALQALGMEGPLARAGWRLDSGVFVGALVRWFLILVFLLAALDVLSLDAVAGFLRDVVLYLPNVIVAALILVVAALVANFLNHLVVGSAKAAHLPSAAFLGGVSKWAIWIFAILAALFQLGIAGPFVQTLFTAFVAALALAVGLSFGLGGRDAAARYLERLRRDISHEM